MLKFFESVISLIFPQRCPFCGAPAPVGERVCKSCAQELPLVPENTCPHCGEPWNKCVCTGNFAFVRCAAPFYYRDTVKQAIYRFKFFGRQGCAPVFALYAAKAVANTYRNIKFDCVTGVPLTKTELRLRGYNQSELFGRSLAKELHLKYKELLIKPHDVPPQRKQKRTDRLKNVLGAFCASRSMSGECVLLVDDIMTTGATLNECAKALKKAGAGKVYCAVIACVKF